LDKKDMIRGLLVGTALAESLAIPYTGWTRARIEKALPNAAKLNHFLKSGFNGSATETSVLVSRALITCTRDPRRFQRQLAEGLKDWFGNFPPNVPKSMIKAGAKLTLGKDLEEAAQDTNDAFALGRASVIGLYWPHDPAKRWEFTIASTTLTHSNWEAVVAASAVASVTAMLFAHAESHANEVVRKVEDEEQAEENEDPKAKKKAQQAKIAALLYSLPKPSMETVTQALMSPMQFHKDDNWIKYVKAFAKAAHMNLPPRKFAEIIKQGTKVNDECYPAAILGIYCWWAAYDDFKGGIFNAISLGGCTGTVAAIAGGLIGATMGKKSMPTNFTATFKDKPLTLELIEKHANTLNEAILGIAPRPPAYSTSFNLVRNAVVHAYMVLCKVRGLLPF
jgi:ADP-ribosylglycohydrolase